MISNNAGIAVSASSCLVVRTAASGVQHGSNSIITVASLKHCANRDSGHKIVKPQLQKLYRLRQCIRTSCVSISKAKFKQEARIDSDNSFETLQDQNKRENCSVSKLLPESNILKRIHSGNAQIDENLLRLMIQETIARSTMSPSGGRTLPGDSSKVTSGTSVKGVFEDSASVVAIPDSADPYSDLVRSGTASSYSLCRDDLLHWQRNLGSCSSPARKPY